jgi:hypothetical protein
LLYRVFHCDISMYICIVTWIGSSPLFFSFLPESPYYGEQLFKIPHMNVIMPHWSFSAWLISLHIMISNSVYVVTNDKIWFFFTDE